MKDNKFDDIIKTLNDESGNISKEISETLYSTKRDKLLMITDLSDDDIIWATGLQAMLHFVIEEFITDKRQKEQCMRMLDDVYKMRISRNRKGREEWFDAIKVTNIQEITNLGLMDKIRNKVGI